MVYTLKCESTRRLILRILHIISCEITVTPLVRGQVFCSLFCPEDQVQFIATICHQQGATVSG